RQVQPPARRAPPPAEGGGAVSAPLTAPQARDARRRAARGRVRRDGRGGGGTRARAAVVSLSGGTGGRVTRETRTQTPFELASGIASAGYSDSPQLNVNLPTANAAGPRGAQHTHTEQ